MPNKNKTETRYVQNPDVVLREEDEDGGLLFNPDTNQVKVINATGLFIWKQFEKENSVETVIDAIKEGYSEVPPDEIAGDVQIFIDGMLETGFFGIVARK